MFICKCNLQEGVVCILKQFPAHIKFENNKKKVQTVHEHCQRTAYYAQKELENVGLGNIAYLAGMLHDIGKLTDVFNSYIEKAVTGEYVKKGSVNHTFAGVKLILDKFHGSKPEGLADITCEIIAFAIGAHHGLFDCLDDVRNGFIYRQEKDDIFYDEVCRNLFPAFISEDTLIELFNKSVEEISAFTKSMQGICKDASEMYFLYGLLCRLVLSSVIEGDRRDTAEFMNNINYSDVVPEFSWNELLKSVEKELQNFVVDSPIAKARTVISESCLAAALKHTGIYRLNVPTGGGKTLASLRFALKHAEVNKIKHIIYVMPLLSIIEQNAAVIKKFVKRDELVLEHHSNFVSVDEGEALDQRELLVETWDAPIIITTLVQLLNTMFAGKTSCVRRFKSLSNSILIFDEVQAVPPKLLSLFNVACNFLTRFCKATIILCSATQPCLEKATHPLAGNIENLIDIDKATLKCFERVSLEDKGNMDYEELHNFILNLLEVKKSVLVVCNTKAEAQKIYTMLPDDDMLLKYSLSANMCAAHRSDVIASMHETLKYSKVVCISTQVIEAGVDISFSSVIRLRAGMDSIVQAAGRCNRNGELEGSAPVYIVNLLEENLSKLPEINNAKTATTSLLVEHAKGNYSNLMSSSAIDYFYKKLYGNMPIGYQDYYKKQGDFYLFDLLGANNKFLSVESKSKDTFLHQAFKLAGSEFDVFEQQTASLLVSYKEGQDVIAEFFSGSYKYNPYAFDKLLKKSRNYTVSVFSYQLEKLLEEKAVTNIEGTEIYILEPDYYNDTLGVVLKPRIDNVMMI